MHALIWSKPYAAGVCCFDVSSRCSATSQQRTNNETSPLMEHLRTGRPPREVLHVRHSYKRLFRIAVVKPFALREILPWFLRIGINFVEMVECRWERVPRAPANDPANANLASAHRARYIHASRRRGWNGVCNLGVVSHSVIPRQFDPGVHL
jgi:hypothetical protein